MGRRSEDDEDLQASVRSRGYQPARADVDHLFARLAQADRDEAELAERALARLPDAAQLAIARFSPTKAPERGRLCKLVGRVAQKRPSAALIDFLLARLEDDDAKTRRNAVIALGKHDDARIEPALLALWDRDASVELRRSIAAALGKMGGADAHARLAALRTDDAELRRITDEALLKLTRSQTRQAPGGIDADARPATPLEVHLHCRWGLAQLCASELEAGLDARVIDEETVRVRLSGPLSSLWQARTALSFGFPLPTGDARDAGQAVVNALTSDQALNILRAFTRGPIRYRIEWSEAGHRRGLTFKVARDIAARRPELLNDPTASLWELVVRERGGLKVELWPRGLDDPRFAYRQAHVPASSHPTLAAALALVAGAHPDDVVWDPFVGAGSELVERARLGPARLLVGTDVAEDALQRARINLSAAGVAAELVLADARGFRPPLQPTLILTNPPMGRRVLNKQVIGALFDAVLDHVARLLAPGGRLVWISPRPADTAERARANGLKLDYRQRVDMGGFSAEIQRFTSASRPRAARRSS